MSVAANLHWLDGLLDVLVEEFMTRQEESANEVQKQQCDKSGEAS